MTAVNVAELKNRLSHYLRMVKDGEEIVIRDRDMPIATITRIRVEDHEAEDLALIAEGKMTPAKVKITGEYLNKLFAIGADLPYDPDFGKGVLAALLEERENGR